MVNVNEIDEKYKEKEAEIQKSISLEFDTVVDKIHAKYEQDYRDMGAIKKEKSDLKGRISELKSILKIFNKEISILTKNKKKLLKQKLKELKKEKAEEIKKAEVQSI
jgi:chromosome segregation ATPase